MTKKWDSGLRVKSPSIVLDVGLEATLAAVQPIAGDKEFSVLLYGGWNEQYGSYFVSAEYYIPLQEVAAASVDYHKTYTTEALRDAAFNTYIEEGLPVFKTKINNREWAIKENLHQLRKNGFTVVAHSHPFLKGSTGSFSSADEQNINSHFPCSILLNGKGEVILASLLLDVGEEKLKIKVETSDITQLIPEVEEIDIIGGEKIFNAYQSTIIQRTFTGYTAPTSPAKPRPTAIVTPGAADEYLGDGVWLSDIERQVDSAVFLGHSLADGELPAVIEAEILRLVKEGSDEAIVRGWFQDYYDKTYPSYISGGMT